MPNDLLLPATLPSGFLFWADFLSSEEERRLLDAIAYVEFSAIEMHGVTAKRRAAHFGLRYSYATKQISGGPPIPKFLLPARERFAKKLDMAPEEFPQALINEYTPGAAIGWHIDGPVYEVIAGFSVGGDCTFKLRPREELSRAKPLQRTGQKIARRKSISFWQPARSAYVMTGDVRWDWEHSIPPIAALRYSITFRSLKQEFRRTHVTGV